MYKYLIQIITKLGTFDYYIDKPLLESISTARKVFEDITGADTYVVKVYLSIQTNGNPDPGVYLGAMAIQDGKRKYFSPEDKNSADISLLCLTLAALNCRRQEALSIAKTMLGKDVVIPRDDGNDVPTFFTNSPIYVNYKDPDPHERDAELDRHHVNDGIMNLEHMDVDRKTICTSIRYDVMELIVYHVI